MEIMVRQTSDWIGERVRMIASRLQEAYSVARQFNLIPPVCEQSEYHLFQREKVEVLLPDVFHKIGSHRSDSHDGGGNERCSRHRNDDLVTTGMWFTHR
jgi:hypothetical protein